MQFARFAAIVLSAVLASGAAARAYGQEDAGALYKSKCQACHGADGKGDTPVGKKISVKDFHAPEVAKMADADLFAITKKGKEKMPAYDKKLTDDQIQALIQYIRSLK